MFYKRRKYRRPLRSRRFRRTRRSRFVARKGRFSSRGYKMRKTSWRLRTKTVVPDFMFVKMRYYDFDSALAGSTAASINSFKGNSLVAINGVGTQKPFGYNTYSGLYNSYTIFGSSIKVSFLNNNGIDLLIGVLPAPSTSTISAGSYATVNAVHGIPYIRTRILSGAGTTTTTGQTWGARTVKHYMTTSKIEGVSRRRIIDDDVYQSSVGSSPAKTWFWYVLAWGIDGTSTFTVNGVSEITYYVKWYARKDLAQ